jgi:ABC-type multidrug transport system ATPase subunit
MTELSFAAGGALRGFDVLVQQTRNQWPESAGRLGDAIVAESLAKTYPDGTEAVRGISLRVAAGESFGILGPNGAGKSTTIGMLGTLVRPTAGRASVAGFDVVAEPIEVRRRIGFAMQQAGVDEFATPKELMILQGRLHGLRKHEAAGRAGLLLGVMELAETPGAPRSLGIGRSKG